MDIFYRTIEHCPVSMLQKRKYCIQYFTNSLSYTLVSASNSKIHMTNMLNYYKKGGVKNSTSHLVASAELLYFLPAATTVMKADLFCNSTWHYKKCVFIFSFDFYKKIYMLWNITRNKFQISKRFSDHSETWHKSISYLITYLLANWI